jgi:hypothetical protein
MLASSAYCNGKYCNMISNDRMLISAIGNIVTLQTAAVSNIVCILEISPLHVAYYVDSHLQPAY